MLDLAIEVDCVYNPKALGVAADARDLGVHLESLELTRASGRGTRTDGTQANQGSTQGAVTSRAAR